MNNKKNSPTNWTFWNFFGLKSISVWWHFLKFVGKKKAEQHKLHYNNHFKKTDWFERQKQYRDGKRSSIWWLTPQIFAAACLALLKPQARNCVWVSYMNGRGPGTWAISIFTFSHVLLGSWIRIRVSGTHCHSILAMTVGSLSCKRSLKIFLLEHLRFYTCWATLLILL